MKRSILYMGSLCLLLALGGCRGDDRAAEPAAPASAAPTPTVAVRLETETPAVTPEVLEALTKGEPDMTPVEVPPETAHEGPDAEDERILAYCVSIKDALPCTVDLDGDGTMETVDMTTRPEESDGCPRWAVSVTRGDQVKLAETDILDDMPWDLWVGDLDEDGSYEIFFHGDEASNDYVIYAWRHDLTPISFEPDDRLVRGNCEQDLTTFAGYVEGFEDGHMVIQGFVDMLGTHWGVRTFAIGDDGVIGPMSTVWAFEEMDDRFLTVKKELTAYKAKVRKEAGEAFLLPVGEKVYPLASDGCERMWFRTGSGKTGVLLLTPDEDTSVMWRIDGVPEAEYFEFLPYSG